VAQCQPACHAFRRHPRRYGTAPTAIPCHAASQPSVHAAFQASTNLFCAASRRRLRHDPSVWPSRTAARVTNGASDPGARSSMSIRPLSVSRGAPWRVAAPALCSASRCLAQRRRSSSTAGSSSTFLVTTVRATDPRVDHRLIYYARRVVYYSRRVVPTAEPARSTTSFAWRCRFGRSHEQTYGS
jgi:hypothetical protein